MFTGQEPSHKLVRLRRQRCQGIVPLCPGTLITALMQTFFTVHETGPKRSCVINAVVFEEEMAPMGTLKGLNVPWKAQRSERSGNQLENGSTKLLWLKEATLITPSMNGMEGIEAKLLVH